MAKRWRFIPQDVDRSMRLERLANIPPVVAQLLVARGVFDAEQAKFFLDAKLSGLRDPDDLPGAAEAADRIFAAIQAKRRIAIYGDYDADGMCATAILFTGLKLLGADVVIHIPNRLDDGYGLNHDALRNLASRGVSQVVSVDCGIASVAQAETARELGIELIITDHHEFGETLPKAAVLVHPRLPGSTYPFGGLCGAGVALKVAWALCRRISNSARVNEPLKLYLLQAVGLAALGAVADVVPLLDENRVLVRHGLLSLREHPPLGLKELLEITRLNERQSLASEDLAFTVAPRLNAAGRLGQALLGVELLTTQSPERATALASYLNGLNSDRESLERSIYLAAVKQIKESYDPEQDPALVLAGEGWHPGVIGIVAGKLAEKYHRPVVMIGLDSMGLRAGMGSARSACGVNLHATLAHCSDYLLSHGGHAAAAGLKIEASQVDAFRQAFLECVAQSVQPADRVPELRIDAEAPLSQLTLQTVQDIERLAPFGEGNPRPLLCASGVRLAEPPKFLGQGERHVAVRLTQHSTQLRGVAFGRGEWHAELAQITGPIDVAYRPVINEFRGRRSVEIHLVDWRLAVQPAAAAVG